MPGDRGREEEAMPHGRFEVSRKKEQGARPGAYEPHIESLPQRACHVSRGMILLRVGVLAHPWASACFSSVRRPLMAARRTTTASLGIPAPCGHGPPA